MAGKTKCTDKGDFWSQFCYKRFSVITRVNIFRLRLFRVLGWCELLIWVSDVLIYLTAIWSTIFEWFCPLSFYSNWKCPQQNTRPWWRSRRMITHWRVVANFTGVLAKVLRASIRRGWYALRISIRSLLVCEKVLYWIRQLMQEQKKQTKKQRKSLR